MHKKVELGDNAWLLFENEMLKGQATLGFMEMDEDKHLRVASTLTCTEVVDEVIAALQEFRPFTESMPETQVAHVVHGDCDGWKWWVSFGDPFGGDDRTFNAPDEESARKLADLINKWAQPKQ